MNSCEVSLSSSDHLAGDLLRATVTFKGQGEIVEWSAAQVHGHCWHDPRLVVSAAGLQTIWASPKVLPPRRTSSASLSVSERKTAMPDMSKWVEGTTCLFATRPHCLAADLMLNNAITFVIQTALPPVLPPSFRGVSTRYAYLLTVCVKFRSEESARVAHIPFYVAGTAGSMGDAARAGPPSSSFKDYLNGKQNGGSVQKKQPVPDHSDEEEELVMLQAALNEDGLGDFEYLNKFPQRYGDWDLTITSSLQDTANKVWFLERDEYDDDGADNGFRASPRAGDYHETSGGGVSVADGVSVRAINAQTGKGRLARCYVHPSTVHPGDAVNIRLDFSGAAERCLKVQAVVEVEERTTGPPPLAAVFEPLSNRRQGAGPWIRSLGSKTLEVSLASACAFSISTYGAPPDFSTDLIIVHTYVRLEFTTETMVCNLRVPLNVRPPTRTTRLVNLDESSVFSRISSPRSPIAAAPNNRLEEQSPPPMPKKKLVF